MSTATDMLAKYLAAESAVLEGKTVNLGGESLGREDLDKIRRGRKEWERKVAAELGSPSFKPIYPWPL